MTVVERMRGECAETEGPEREEPREGTADEDFLIDMLTFKYIAERVGWCGGLRWSRDGRSS